jgi:hypothetical protein
MVLIAPETSLTEDTDVKKVGVAAEAVQFSFVTLNVLPSSPICTARVSLEYRIGLLQKKGAPERHDAGSEGEKTLSWNSRPIMIAITSMAHP